ncbi:MAG: hypothetical protein JRI23_19115, partial [Deltaproteobacteria bacterium]|nr:hypothetical protein [Deltaproteobacteria bacterium]MBW2533976.1 hypothetical protein [Deltaproteobacteria bacterium]
GTDDDGDQDIDCADADCQQDWECAVEPVAGWEGPYAVYLGPAAATPPDCSGPWSSHDDYGIGIQIPQAQCTSCSCSTPDVQCSLPTTTLYAYNGCNSGDEIQVLTPTGDGVCLPLSTTYVEAVGTVASVDQGSSCTASGGNYTAAPVTWNQTLRVCRGDLVLGGCGGQQVCAPLEDTSFSRCILRAGIRVCPAPYTSRTEFYATFTDTRACTTCTCGAPSNVQCDGVTELFDEPGCGSAPIEAYSAMDRCDGGDLPDITNGSFRYLAFNSSGSCSSQGGQLTGTATEADVTTLCCLP